EPPPPSSRWCSRGTRGRAADPQAGALRRGAESRGAPSEGLFAQQRTICADPPSSRAILLSSEPALSETQEAPSRYGRGPSEPPVGIEPTTYSLRVNRSAD